MDIHQDQDGTIIVKCQGHSRQDSRRPIEVGLLNPSLQMTPRNRRCASQLRTTCWNLSGVEVSQRLVDIATLSQTILQNLLKDDSDMLDIISWIGASKMLWTAGSIFFGTLKTGGYNIEPTAESQATKLAKQTCGRMKAMGPWNDRRDRQTDEERCDKGLIHACFWLFTTDLQRKAPETQF